MADTYQPFIHDFINEHAITQGMYFERAFTLPALPDLTGMNIKCQVRKSFGDPKAFLTFQLSDNTIVISGTTTKTLTMKQDGNVMNIPVGNYIYDVVAYNDAQDPIPVMKGIFPIQPKSTQL